MNHAQQETQQKIQLVTQLVLMELLRAQRLHPPMASNHEARAVIEEEFDEWWAEVKAIKSSHGESTELTKEGCHLAAMTLRFLVERVSVDGLLARIDKLSHEESSAPADAGEPRRTNADDDGAIGGG